NGGCGCDHDVNGLPHPKEDAMPSLLDMPKMAPPPSSLPEMPPAGAAPKATSPSITNSTTPGLPIRMPASTPRALVDRLSLPSAALPSIWTEGPPRAFCGRSSPYDDRMLVFAYEHMNSGVFAGSAGVDSWQAEGWAMLSAVLQDLQRCPGVETVTLL